MHCSSHELILSRRSHHGISLFEVLISILVASIGVFGVLILIPFAVKNAQTGIDREAAINAAKNFYADFQAYGYHDTATWYDDDLTPHLATLMPPFNANSTNIVEGWPYVIDPIGSATFADSGDPYAQFPKYDPADYTPSNPVGLPHLNRITLLDPNATVAPFGINLGLARRLAMPQDTLIFDQPDDELAPPIQRYMILDSVSGVKRQYEGKYTVAAVMVPLDDERKQYRMFVIVLGIGDQLNARVFQVNDTPPTGGGGPDRTYEFIALGGGDLILTEITPTENKPAAENRNIRNNDWMMLINYYSEGIGTPVFDDVQIDFYRVVHAASDDVTNDEYGVTLQGTDFDVFPDWDPAAPAGTQASSVTTYAVLIPNALAVYERTIRTEPDSAWTN